MSAYVSIRQHTSAYLRFHRAVSHVLRQKYESPGYFAFSRCDVPREEEDKYNAQRLVMREHSSHCEITSFWGTDDNITRPLSVPPVSSGIVSFFLYISFVRVVLFERIYNPFGWAAYNCGIVSRIHMRSKQYIPTQK